MDLDAWLPDPQVRTVHRRPARAGPGELWRAAESLRVGEARTLGRIVRWRMGGRDVVPRDLTFRELFRRHPFAVLDEGEGWSISGLAGRIWTLEPDYPRLEGPDAFLGWQEPGTVRVLFAHWVEPDGDGGSVLHSEARVEPVDRRAALRLRALWAVVARFERLIGGEALGVAARRAEGR